MRVGVLGSLRVEVDARVSAPRGARSRDLLAVLVARRGRPVPTETLLDLVWGDESLVLTPTALHTAVARLRGQTESGLVRSTDLGYVIAHDVECDADVFTELVADTNVLDATMRVDRLRDALALWSGPHAYAGVSDHLVLAERARLDDLRHRAIAQLSGALLDLGGEPEGREAYDLARTLVLANPLDESAAALAMRAAYRSQGQAESLEIHESLRRALRDELGVRPGVQIRDLHSRVLAQDPSLEAAHERAAPASPLTLLHPGRLVPIPPSPTIGREADVARVLDALASGRRLVTVTGPGGVGKSRLLAEVGAALTGSREVAHIALGGHAALPVDELAASVALSAGLSLVDDDPVAGLVAALRTSAATILADEAEWVLGSAAALASALLAGCPGVSIVVTSRVPLSVVGERIVVLEPLATADPRGPMEDIRGAAAVRLLVERLSDRGDLAADVQEIADDDLRVVAEVAHRLDGLPLALEIVAGSAAGGPLPDLPEVAEMALDVTVEDHGRDERHRSLRGALTWGVGRLGPEARVVLRRLGVFAGPFTTAAAKAVVGDGAGQVDRAVRELARHNLLRVERTPTALSFRMLRVVRDLARDELASAGEEEATRQRHRQWFAGAWRDSALSDDLVEHVGRTHDDHVEALTDALAHEDDAAAADIALALCRRWQFVEASAFGLRWIARVLARPGLSDVQRARLHICRAGFMHVADWDAPQHDRMRQTLEQDPEWAGLLELSVVLAAYGAGDLKSALEHVDHARLVAAGAPHLLPEIVATRAVVDAASGASERAVAGAHEALARVGVTRSAIHAVTVVPKVGLALLDAGRPRESLDLLTTAAADAEARFGIRPTSTTAINAGWAALSVGDPSTSLSWFRQALIGPQAATVLSGVGEATSGAGAALVALRHPRSAEVLGLGRELLERTHQELPLTLNRLVADAETEVGVTAPPADWSNDLLLERINQLVADAAQLAPT